MILLVAFLLPLFALEMSADEKPKVKPIPIQVDRELVLHRDLSPVSLQNMPTRATSSRHCLNYQDRRARSSITQHTKSADHHGLRFSFSYLFQSLGIAHISRKYETG